ncbi:eukaryotic translation initiation factor 3 subunit J-like isoform X2 [Xenopus laevis]|uniref:Eukaryotic translation initiation factor 3 subunit J n=1 Tax=Xenopus laevis TaxID=8355 RepID=A0A8J0URN2_XENLA|nr:eukaryotic translation initiation factor 3 subunit J-like isoform X2 [Xenopus laevis]
MAENDNWDADDFDPEDLNQKGAASGPVTVRDRWDGEDEEEDVKDNWDDEEEAGGAAKKEPQITVEQKVPEKKKLLEKIKEKEKLQKQRKEELKKQVQTLESSNTPELTPEEQLSEKLRLKKLQEDSDLELAKEAFGDDVTVTGIDAMNPSTREDFTEFGKLLKEKITLYERSLYYPGFLEALVRDVSLSLEVEDLKKINNSLTVLCFEKQKQEKLQSKAKKKKKGVVPGGGLKANMKNDLADYGGMDEGYGREFDDFM